MWCCDEDFVWKGRALSVVVLRMGYFHTGTWVWISRELQCAGYKKEVLVVYTGLIMEFKMFDHHSPHSWLV